MSSQAVSDANARRALSKSIRKAETSELSLSSALQEANASFRALQKRTEADVDRLHQESELLRRQARPPFFQRWSRCVDRLAEQEEQRTWNKYEMRDCISARDYYMSRLKRIDATVLEMKEEIVEAADRLRAQERKMTERMNELHDERVRQQAVLVRLRRVVAEIDEREAARVKAEQDRQRPISHKSVARSSSAERGRDGTNRSTSPPCRDPVQSMKPAQRPTTSPQPRVTSVFNTSGQKAYTGRSDPRAMTPKLSRARQTPLRDVHRPNPAGLQNADTHRVTENSVALMSPFGEVQRYLPLR